MLLGTEVTVMLLLFATSMIVCLHIFEQVLNKDAGCTSQKLTYRVIQTPPAELVSLFARLDERGAMESKTRCKYHISMY